MDDYKGIIGGIDLSLDKLPDGYYVKRAIVKALDNWSTSAIEELYSSVSKLTDAELASSIRESTKELKTTRMNESKSRNKGARPSGMVAP